VFWNINNELVRKDILRDQIGEIRQEISLVDHYYESCNGAYWAVHTFNGNTNAYKGIEELGQKHIKECASVQNFVEFTNNLIIEPELAGIKDELILMSDLLDDFSTEVIHEENAEVDYRDEADKEIPRQKTRILESIKSIEIKNDL
jgi:hypothetical protein